MYEEISTNKPQSHPQYDSAECLYRDSFRDVHSQTLLEIEHRSQKIEHLALKESLPGAQHELECNFDKDFSHCIPVEFANAQEEDDGDSSHDYNDKDEDKEDAKTSQEEEELSQSEEEEGYPQLSVDDVLDKLDDADINGDYVLLEDVRHIGSDNLEKLQTLSRSNPVIKRLFTNNRLTLRDVKNTTIDSDIKSAVSEFLKNNVVGNFIISRVLRENYATFYGWLATHLQCERNSWLVRLKQTLDHYEVMRRDNIGNNDVIVDSAQKVEMLLELCRQSVPPSSNFGYGTGIQKLTSLQPLPRLSDHCFTTSENKEIGSKVKSQFKQNTRRNVPSSPAAVSNVIMNDGDSETSKERYNSVESKTNDDDKNGPTHLGRSTKTEVVHSDSSTQLKSTKIYKSRTEETSLQFDGAIQDSVNTRKQSIGGTGDCMDWKEVLRHSFQQLQELCEYLVLDRQDCLRSMGANSSVTLTEAVTAFVNKRKTSGQCKRREIEQRLSLLETENKELLQEMATLQNLLSDKQNDALNLQKQLDKLEKLLSSATCDKLHKCIGTDDTERPLVSNGGHKQRNSHSDNIKQIPYRYKMMSNSNATQKVSKEKENTISNIRRLEQERRELQVNHDMFNLTHNLSEKHNDINSVENQTNKAMVKEKSLIEISEEKLKILKQRAQKLEHSLHDAISSMTLLHKKKEDGDDSSPQLDSQPAARPSQGNQPMKSLAKTLHVKGSSPRLAVIRRPMSQGRSQSETLLQSEPTSFLTGRSVALTSHNPTDRSLAQSVLTVMTDKHKSDIQTKRDYELYVTNREPGFGNHTSREQGTGKAVKVKVISRHRTTSNGMVSKCLRCQKLFCAVDNHKLACFYHTKDKERIEHYDQTGKLIRVAQVWVCCHQPQEIEGCCYGQHI